MVGSCVVHRGPGMDTPQDSDGHRRRIGGGAAVVLFLTCWLWPMGLPEDQHRLLAILFAVVALWVSEALPIPVTALLIAPSMVAAGITDAKSAFAPYADPLLFLFYGSFFIAMALQRHGLDRRLAQALVSSRFVAGVPWRTRAAMMTAGMILSMWISNTASTAILVPILLATLGGSALAGMSPDGKRVATTGGLLAIAYACSMGGMGTLVGTPPNLITVGLLAKVGTELTFFDWASVGVPTAAAMVAVIYLVFSRRYPPPAAPSHAEHTDFGPLSRGEWVTALSFVLAITGWIVPGALKALGAASAPVIAKALPSGGVAILAASVLFAARDENDKPVLPWPEARNIDWGLIMLFGGGISLGGQMFKTGLAKTLGQGFIELTGVSDMWTLTAVGIAFTIFFTEVCSNTATSSMVVPLIIGVATELGISPVPPALGVGLAASCAFMMPIATGPNAIVYGTGEIALPDMIRIGTVLNLLGGIVIFVMLRILCPLYGWT